MSYWLTGMDEAGYGPLLGPLVVGLATLHCPQEIRPRAPWKLLAPTVTRKYRSNRIAVDDSKRLHRRGNLAPLETGVLAFVAAECSGEVPTTFRALLEHLTQGQTAYLEDYPWYQDQDIDLPVSVDSLELLGAVRKLRRRLDTLELQVSEVRALPLDVIEFNQRVDELTSKGDVNAWAMGRFLKWLWQKQDRGDLGVWTDRLGGRTHYGPFLYPLFPGARFEVVEQEDEIQSYKVTSEERQLFVSFRKDGEDHCFTTALASMTAKYVRELHMMLFNRWWAERVPNLKPTAGYYQDGRRFLADIDSARRTLDVGSRLLVRRR